MKSNQAPDLELLAGSVIEEKVRHTGNEEKNRHAPEECPNQAGVREKRAQGKNRNEEAVVNEIGPPDFVRKLNPGCGGLNRDIKEVEIACEPEKKDLNKIENEKPVKAPGFKVRIEEKSHAEGCEPEKENQVLNPLNVLRGVKRVVVGSQRLGHHETRESDEGKSPKIAPDVSGAARSLISGESAKSSHDELHQVGKEWPGGAGSPFQEN